MKPYQERVVTEKAELDIKRHALFTFINSDEFDSLTPADQGLLVVQADAMTTYASILTQRIHSFHRSP